MARFSKLRIFLAVCCVVLLGNLLWARHITTREPLSGNLPIPTSTDRKPLLSATTEGGNRDVVSAATYNIWNTMFGWEVRRLHIAEMLAAARPDFVALQEVRQGYVSLKRDKEVDQAAELAALMGTDYRWRSYNAVREVLPGLREGIALLSRPRPCRGHRPP